MFVGVYRRLLIVVCCPSSFCGSVLVVVCCRVLPVVVHVLFDVCVVYVVHRALLFGCLYVVCCVVLFIV